MDTTAEHGGGLQSLLDESKRLREECAALRDENARLCAAVDAHLAICSLPVCAGASSLPPPAPEPDLILP